MVVGSISNRTKSEEIVSCLLTFILKRNLIKIIINTLNNWVVLQLLIRSQVNALYRMYMHTCITIMCKVICNGIII